MSAGDRQRALVALTELAEDLPEVRAIRGRWIDAYSMRLGALGANGSPQNLAAMAEEVYPSKWFIDPVEAAESDFLEWPPHDD